MLTRLRLVPVAMLALGVPLHSFAATFEAKSPAREDVEAAVALAKDGDVVSVPAGTARWTTPAKNTPSLRIAEGITLQGAGPGKTVIVNDTEGEWNAHLIQLVGKPGGFYRVTGFTFRRGKSGSGIQIQGSSKTFRVDHCRFEQTALGTYGETFGVVDNCEFIESAVMVEDTDDAAWERPLALGTADAVYVENCSFDNDGGDVIDGKAGGRYVFRNNMVTDGFVHGHGRDTGDARSLFSFEIYDNVLIATTNVFRGVFLRGGTGVIYRNTLHGFRVPIDLTHYCACGGSCTDYPKCTVYPCLDQVGRSADIDGDGEQELEPLYAWGNIEEGAPAPVRSNCSFIAAGRDFYDGVERPGYRAYPFPHPLRDEQIVEPADGGVPDAGASAGEDAGRETAPDAASVSVDAAQPLDAEVAFDGGVGRDASVEAPDASPFADAAGSTDPDEPTGGEPAEGSKTAFESGGCAAAGMGAGGGLLSVLGLCALGLRRR